MSIVLSVHSLVSVCMWYNVCACIGTCIYVVGLKLTGVAIHLRLMVITANNHYRPLCAHCVTMTTDPSVRSVSPLLLYHSGCTRYASCKQVCSTVTEPATAKLFQPVPSHFSSWYLRTFQGPCYWSCGHSLSALLSDLFTLLSRSWFNSVLLGICCSFGICTHSHDLQHY